jgi:hypothetical protein
MMMIEGPFFGFNHKEDHPTEFELYIVFEISVNVPCGGSA